MKISIVIPSNNDRNYIDFLIHFIKENTYADNIHEIIIVEAFSSKEMIKLAEKTHAKLYFNTSADKKIQMEIGAYHVTSEIIYFINPGCIPPAGFDERILKFVQKNNPYGSFDFEFKKTDSLIIRLQKIIRRIFYRNFFNAPSFFIKTQHYFKIGGLKNYKKELLLQKKLNV